MTALELIRKQDINNKNKNIIKVSNNYIEGFIRRANVNAVKILFYLAKADIEGVKDERMVSFKIDTKDMLAFCNISMSSLKSTLLSLQKTSIVIADDEISLEAYNLIPHIKILYGKNTLEVSIFTKIFNLIKEVKNKYTIINVESFMQLKGKHTLKMLQLLSRIKGYDSFVAKRKYYSLEEINSLFGTNYSNCAEIQRRILKPCKQELDNSSKISFIYEIEYESKPKRGRPKAIGFTIDVVKNVIQLSLF